MSPGAYYAAPEGGGPARLLAIVAVAVVVGGGGIWLVETKPWLPPAEPQQQEAQEEEAAAPEPDLGVPFAPPKAEEEAAEEEEAPLPVPARAAQAEAPALPVIFVEGFACRAVESNSVWMAVAFQVAIGTSDTSPTSGLSVKISVLDADGFMLEDTPMYPVGVAPGNNTLLQDRVLVKHPQASRSASCKVEVQSKGVT
ncbi:MAG TPA: hypothetical protein VF414_13070, partial [Thermoanaerobaculia bacterium]